MEQKKYHSIVRLGHRDSFGALHEGANISIQEKIDGCFHYNTPVLLSNGETEKIGKIVNNKMDIEVMSYNFNTGNFESRKITNWYNHGEKKDFIAIRVASTKGSRPNRIICTRDHLFYTDKGFVQAGDLSESDKLYTLSDKLSEVQKQLVLGTLLGDASAYPPNREGEVRNRGIEYSHSNKQIEYKNLKDKVLDKYFSNTRPYVSGFGSDGMKSNSRCTLATSEVIGICYSNGKKRVSNEWLNELSPIGLAFWYMDDGSLSHHHKQRDRAVLHTQGFDEEEIDLIINYLNTKWNIKASKIYNRSGYMVCMNADSSDIFFNLVSPYIHNSMKYKLPTYYRNDYCYWDYFKEQDGLGGLVELRFLGFDELPNYLSNFNNYDIEVEGNHNYFVNGVLVHNSNASYLKVGEEVKAFSRNLELSAENTLGGFYEWVKDNIHHSDILDNVVYFGEWTNPHRVKYEGLEKRFFLYDIYDLEKEQYLHSSVVKEEAERIGLYLAPVFYEGEYISHEHIESFVGKTMLDGSLNGETMGEGVVIKNFDYRSKYGKQVFVKAVSDKFVEIHQGKVKVKKEDSEEKVFAMKTVTKNRVDKIMRKLQDEGHLSDILDLSEMGMYLKTANPIILSDILSEESDMLSEDFDEKELSRSVSKMTPKLIREFVTDSQKVKGD